MNEEWMNEWRMNKWRVIWNSILIAAQAVCRWGEQQRHVKAPPKWYKAQIQYIQPAEGRKRCAMQLAHGLRQSHSQAATNILRYGLLLKYSSFPDQTIWGRLLWGIVPNPTVILHIVTTCLGESRKVWLGCVHVWVQCEGREWAITQRKMQMMSQYCDTVLTGRRLGCCNGIEARHMKLDPACMYKSMVGLVVLN